MKLGLIVAAATTLLTVVTTAPALSLVDDPPDERGPNIVVITADDMRADDLRYMPQTRRLLGQLKLTDFVSNHPLCCPSRAEMLTGQFGHNNGVHHNNGPRAYSALEDKDNTIATWLDEAGYATSVAGKFINGWDPDDWPRPAGWDRMSVLLDPTAYDPFEFVFWRDGELARPGGHNNDAVTAESVRHIEAGLDDGAPVFHWASYTSPHTSTNPPEKWRKWRKWPIPAERHALLFPDVRPPSEGEPSYVNVPSQRWVRSHQARVQSLQSVDEGVADIVAAVELSGELEDTVFVFTSDNGYLLGEHGLRGKNVAYEESLRVPLLASGPGVDSGKSAKGSMMTDIAPSLAALAGVSPGRPQDGRADLFSLEGGWEQILIQGGNDDHTKDWWWRGIRESRWVYVRFVDRAPLMFNRVTDPHQVKNLAGRRPRIETRLRTALPEVDSLERERQRVAPRGGEAAR